MDNDSVQLSRILSVIGAVLEYMSPNRLYFVIVALLCTLRTSMPIIVQMLFALYSFAVLGMDLFGAVAFDNDGVDVTDLAEHYLWGSNMLRDTSWRSFNFGSIESAMHFLFVDIIANNWHIFKFGFADILQSHKMYGEYGDVSLDFEQIQYRILPMFHYIQPVWIDGGDQIMDGDTVLQRLHTDK